MQFHVTILCSSYCNGPRSATKKHGFQNIKGVFSHCAGAFSVGNDCVHSRTACECRKFSSVATLKVLFFAWFLAFFALQVVFVFVPLARFLDFRKCFHAHKWAGACFSLYDIGQTGATSRPLPEYAPRSGRDTRTPCPRWKPHNVPRREEYLSLIHICILTCKEKLIGFYEKFGYVNLGISDSKHGGAVWYDMILEFKK